MYSRLNSHSRKPPCCTYSLAEVASFRRTIVEQIKRYASIHLPFKTTEYIVQVMSAGGNDVIWIHKIIRLNGLQVVGRHVINYTA